MVDPICLPRSILWIPLPELSFRACLTVLLFCFYFFFYLMCRLFLQLPILILFINFTSLISKIHTVVEMLSALDLDPMFFLGASIGEYSELLSYDAYPRLNLH